MGFPFKIHPSSVLIGTVRLSSLPFNWFFFPDWSTLKTTSAVPFPTTSSSPSESTQSTQEQFTTAIPDNSCYQNITVVYPVSSFCTHRADGLYVKSDSPKTFYRCVQRKTFVTKCHTLGTEHSSAVTITPSKDLYIVSFVLATLFHLSSVWSNRWFCFLWITFDYVTLLSMKENKWYENVNLLTLPIIPSEAHNIHLGTSSRRQWFKWLYTHENIIMNITCHFCQCCISFMSLNHWSFKRGISNKWIVKPLISVIDINIKLNVYVLCRSCG